MLNIINKAGILTFEFTKKGTEISISCRCIKDEYIDLIVNEFQRTVPNNKEVKSEMERPI